MCGMYNSASRPSAEQRSPRMQYISKPSPALSSIEQGVFPDHWGVRPEYPSHYQIESPIRDRGPDAWALPASPRESKGPARAALPFNTKADDVPYERYIDVPHTQGPAPSPPWFSHAASPSLDETPRSSTITSIESRPAPLESPVTPFPGTMTSRDERKSAPRKHTSSKKHSQRKLSLAHRCKAMVKDIFTHRPVDESELDRIESRHWTEEDDY